MNRREELEVEMPIDLDDEFFRFFGKDLEQQSDSSVRERESYHSPRQQRRRTGSSSSARSAGPL